MIVFTVHLDALRLGGEDGAKPPDGVAVEDAAVCVEDLQVRNMSKSAAGTADAPGKNVRAKSGLNKAILDQGWFEFRRPLDYKLAWAGGWLIAVPAQNTSLTCPCCAHVSTDNRKTQARFLCVESGYEANADLVGAINILARGHRVAACGEARQSAPSAKQEPADVGSRPRYWAPYHGFAEDIGLVRAGIGHLEGALVEGVIDGDRGAHEGSHCDL